jgi:hypothetical protein
MSLHYGTHVLQPWQISELVFFLGQTVDGSDAWCLGHRLLQAGVVSVQEGSCSSADFDDAGALWRALVESRVMFAGKWAEVMDMTLDRARRTEESVSFFYSMCYVCARDEDPALLELAPVALTRLRVEPRALLSEARRGVLEREGVALGKRRRVDPSQVDDEVLRVAPFLAPHVQSARRTAARTARAKEGAAP